MHLPVDVLAGAGKLRDSPATHAPTLLLSVPHLIQRAQAHNPADAALSLKSRAAHGSGNTQSNNQQLGLHEQLIFFEASRGLPYDNIYQFRISYNKRTSPPTLRLLKSRATHRGFKPTPTINNLGYIRNWFYFKSQEVCAPTPFLSDPHHIRAQSRWHFAVATKNRLLQPSLYWWFWRKTIGYKSNSVLSLSLTEGLIHSNSSLIMSPHVALHQQQRPIIIRGTAYH